MGVRSFVHHGIVVLRWQFAEFSPHSLAMGSW